MKKIKLKNKKLNTYVPTNGGLLIGETVSVDVKKYSSVQRFLLWIVALCGIFGELLCLSSLYSLEYDTCKVVAYLLMSFLVSAVVFSMRKRAFAIICEIGIMILAFMKLPKEELFIGFKCFVNQIVDEAKLGNYGVIEFYISRKVDEFECLTLFMTVFVVLTAFLVTFAVIMQKSFALGFIFTFPLIEVGLFFGIAPDYIHFAFLLAFWIALVALNNSNYKEYTGNQKSDFVRKGNSFMPKFGMKRKVDSASAMCCLTISLIVFLSVAVVVQILDVERPDSVNQLRYTLKHGLTENSLEDIIDTLSGNNGESDHGSLKNKGNLEFKNEDMLKLEFSSKMNSPVYFKGYVGSVYDGDSWTELGDNDFSELSDIMDDFSLGGYFPQDRLFRYLRSNYELLPSATVDVDIINASTEFCYTPYAMTVTEDLSYYGDSVVFVERDAVTLGDSTIEGIKASYDYEFAPVNFEQFMSQHYTVSDLNYYSNKALSDYNDFCEKVYTKLPFDEDLEKLKDIDEYSDIFEAYQNGELNAYETLCEIRDLIHSKTEYTLSPGDTPRNTDFVYYFLEENGEGYCVHYASAGIILARMAGIPARYATGFIASTDKFNLLSKTGNGYEFILKDDAAHAWAEVYIKGMGWVPFEFTEGYSSQNAVTTTTAVTTRSTTRRTTGSSSNTRLTGVTTNSTKTTTTAPIIKLNTDNDGDVKNILKIAVVILGLILFVVLIVMIIIRSHTVSVINRKNSIRTKSNNKNAVNAYRYLVSLLEYCGVEYNNVTPLEFANAAEIECPFVNSGEIVEACNIAMMADYGNTNVASEEVNSIAIASENLAKRIYDSKSKMEKFKMKYIEHLI